MQSNRNQTGEAGESNQTLLQAALGGPESPVDIYEAGVGGVMLVGAIFTCGLIMALAYVCWQIVNGMADSTLETIFCCINCFQRRCRGRRWKDNIDDVDDPDGDDADDEDESGKFPRGPRNAEQVAE